MTVIPGVIYLWKTDDILINSLVTLQETILNFIGGELLSAQEKIVNL